MGDVWFTSDTHFGHAMLVDRGHRPHRSVADMNADLIARWNTRVRPRDVVWHLGDWGMGPLGEHLAILGQLHGEVHLVTGNHDRPWPGHRDSHKHQAAWLRAGFASVQAFARRRIHGRQVMLSHFPYSGDHTGEERAGAFRLRDTGIPLLHGHVHAEWKTRGRQVNVGVDVHDFAPIHLDEVAQLLPPATLDPDGIKRALYLRAHGWTWRAIGDDLGVPADVVLDTVGVRPRDDVPGRLRDDALGRYALRVLHEHAEELPEAGHRVGSRRRGDDR